MTDLVNHPPHYQFGDIECIEAIEAQLTPEEYRGYLKGNIAKYMWRERWKGGLESVQKAQWYLERLIVHDEVGQNKEEANGCKDGFCPLPGVRTGPSEPLSEMFDPI